MFFFSFVIGDLAYAGTKRNIGGNLVQITTLKPRGADGGPKRAPPHLGDAWHHKLAYEVEEVFCLWFKYCFVYRGLFGTKIFFI